MDVINLTLQLRETGARIASGMMRRGPVQEAAEEDSRGRQLPPRDERGRFMSQAQVAAREEAARQEEERQAEAQRQEEERQRQEFHARQAAMWQERAQASRAEQARKQEAAQEQQEPQEEEEQKKEPPRSTTSRDVLQGVAGEIPGFDTRVLGAGGFAGAVAAAAGAAVGFSLSVVTAEKSLTDLGRSRGIISAAEIEAAQALKEVADRISLARQEERADFAERQKAQLEEITGEGRLDAFKARLIQTELPASYLFTGEYKSVLDGINALGNMNLTTMLGPTAPEVSAYDIRDKVEPVVHVAVQAGNIIAETDLDALVVNSVKKAFQSDALADALRTTLGRR